MDHIKWPKTARLENIGVIITEKLDGSNGLIAIDAEGNMKVGSRNRWLTLKEDNFGFAAWCEEHRDELKALPEGYHYGEWIGRGIQRGYQYLDREFHLFEAPCQQEDLPECLNIVPFRGSCGLGDLTETLESIRKGEDLQGLGLHHTVERSCLNINVQAEGLIVHIPKMDRRFKVIWNQHGYDYK